VGARLSPAQLRVDLISTGIDPDFHPPLIREHFQAKPIMGNDDPWKAWKTKPTFSPLPTALGNPERISTFPRPRLLSLYKDKEQQRTW
jgi:hypothetical protein